MTPWTDIAGDSTTGLLLIADHASNHVPAGIDLGIAPDELERHIAIDIGVAPLAAALCARLGCPGILAAVSRLVIDYNREEDAAGLIPHASDGTTIPGNIGVDPAERLARFWRPYHDHIADRIAEDQPSLLISLHSFTPQLRSGAAEPRMWEVGVLYNVDARAARLAIPALAAAGVVVGDNLPYSGRQLNATMNRHGEANAIPYLGLELRQDLIGEGEGVARWADRLIPVVRATLAIVRA